MHWFAPLTWCRVITPLRTLEACYIHIATYLFYLHHSCIDSHHWPDVGWSHHLTWCRVNAPSRTLEACYIHVAYQFLSACFRNLTNAIYSTYYQAFTMRNVWESVVSEAWRGSPFILMGHTMQPDRILDTILIGFFFFWRVNAKT